MYKQNFKKVVKLMVDDVWSKKRQAAVNEYRAGATLANGKETPVSGKYEGLKYAEQEKKRLNRIVHGKTTDSIVGQRSSKYGQRAKATDLTKLCEPLPWSKPKVRVAD